MADSRIDELRRRLARDPGSRLFAQLAEEHRKAGEHAEAIRVARAGLVQHPNYPSARLTLGRAMLDSGDPAGARIELEAALRDAPDNILASRFLGQALESLGELGPALLQLQNTLKMAPGDRQLESQIASIHSKLRAPQPPAPAPKGPVAAAAAGPSEVTAPFARPVAPAPVEADDVRAGPLPPTIRIHMPADRAARPHTMAAPPPLPPSAAPSAPLARPVEAGVAPATSRLAIAEAAVTTLPASPPPMSAEPFYESDVAPTLPTALAPGLDAADEAARAPYPPTLLAGAVAAEETVFESEVHPGPTAVGRPVPLPASALEDVAAAVATPLSSSTLAELYFRQGLVDRAVEVYRQVLAEEPGNERARARLAEIESAPRPDDARSARRAALERTITGLEALLVVLQRK